VKFTEAGSGLEAIERVAVAPVDLMILDLNMPRCMELRCCSS
jgi:two-component system chemotaxis response regulator CheY